jgi:hypothetical protein
MVVAPNGFTKGAIALANSVGVELHNSNSLRRWIGRIRPEPQEQRTVDLDGAEIQPESQASRTVNLDAERAEYKEENTMAEGAMQKHTISLGNDRIGETVSFTAKLLGTAQVNGGKAVNDKGAMDWTYYRLPDDTYRVLIDDGSTTLLLPSNFAEAMSRGEPVEYGRWTIEELENEGEYGRVFKELMKRHPEGRKRIVRDLD